MLFVFSTHFSVFGNRMKHSSSCVIYYYIDTSVLLENTPLVRNYIRNPGGVFSISSLAMILMTSFPLFHAWLFMQTVGENGER